MRRTAQDGGRRRWSLKVLVGTTTLALVALGTGISLAATQDAGGQQVTCIVQADAAAAADAATAKSDVFAVGTKLHFSSAGRTVDVTVSAPLTAAAPPAAGTNAGGANNNNGGAKNNGGKKNNGKKNNGKNNGKKNNGKNKGKNKGKKNKGKGKKHQRQQRKVAAKATNAVATTTATIVPAVSPVRVAKAAAGVDPNTVCATISKDAFDTLGNVSNGNNVGAFLATMIPVNGGGGNNGKQNGKQA